MEVVFIMIAEWVIRFGNWLHDHFFEIAVVIYLVMISAHTKRTAKSLERIEETLKERTELDEVESTLTEISDLLSHIAHRGKTERDLLEATLGGNHADDDVLIPQPVDPPEHPRR
jgi:hypothetical protein